MALGRLSLIVRTESRRRWRIIWEDPAKSLFAFIVGIVVLVSLPIAAVAGYAGGERLVSGDADGTTVLAGTIVLGVLAYVAFVTVMRHANNDLRSPGSEPLLQAVRHEEIVVAHLAMYSLPAIGVVGLPGLVGGVALALGAGSPASLLVVPLVSCAVAVLGTLVGIALSLLVRTAAARIRIIARFRTWLSIGLTFGWVALFASGSIDAVFAVLPSSVTVPVLVALGELTLLGAAPTARVPVAVAAFAGIGIAVAVAGVIAVRLTETLWYESDVEPRDAAHSSAMEPVSILTGQRGYVARKALLRARRSPIRLLYVLYPALFGFWILAAALSHGSVPSWAPIALALYGAWGAGAAFTLNPIGEASPMLPVTLTAPITGRTYVSALWATSVLVGVPITVVASVGSGILAGYEPLDLVLVCTLGALLAALAPAFATGIGAVFPGTEASQIPGDREAVTPSTIAFICYSIGLPALALPMWLAGPGSLRSGVATSLGVSPTALALLAALLAIALVGLSGGYSLRVACRRFDRYTTA